MAIKTKSVRVADNRICTEVEPGQGTSGTRKQFIDLELKPEQLQQLKDQLNQEVK